MKEIPEYRLAQIRDLLDVFWAFRDDLSVDRDREHREVLDYLNSILKDCYLDELSSEVEELKKMKQENK